MRLVVIRKNVTTDIQHLYTTYNYMLIGNLIHLIPVRLSQMPNWLFDESVQGIPSIRFSAWHIVGPQ